jgi:CII-binding regulator of phage lambda lysogenization HflD
LSEKGRISRGIRKAARAVKNLRKRYKDKPYISFTDLTSIAIINEMNIIDVLTDDDHFLQVGLSIVETSLMPRGGRFSPKSLLKRNCPSCKIFQFT